MPLVSISGNAPGLVKGMLENCSIVIASLRYPLVLYLLFSTASVLAKIGLRSLVRLPSWLGMNFGQC